MVEEKTTEEKILEKLNSIRKLLVTIVCISGVILLFVWFIYAWMPAY